MPRAKSETKSKTARGKSQPPAARRPPTSAGQHAEIEWLGGTVLMPRYVTGEGEPYRPEILFWLGQDGAILGSAVERPSDLLKLANESLQRTIAQPMHGPPHAPTRVRVSSRPLADVLRIGHPELEVVCAPTPELDELFERMTEHFASNSSSTLSYLPPDGDPSLVAALFDTAAQLYRSAPWKTVPDDQSLIGITIEQLDVHDSVVSVLGHAGQSFGLVVFDKASDFESYLDAASSMDSGQKPVIPSHMALTFERGADIEPEFRKEIAEHGWKVASANAHPSLHVIDSDFVARTATKREILVVQAVAYALRASIDEDVLTPQVWLGNEPFSQTYTLDGQGHSIEITLRAPVSGANTEFSTVSHILDALASLEVEDDELDYEKRSELEEKLLARFDASPEAAKLDGLMASGLLGDLGASYMGRTIATVSHTELREIVFDLFPRKVSVGSEEARPIIEELRALYRFLRREGGLEQADACLRVLGGSAIKKLEAKLADPGNFGMAKSLVMRGHEAGVDITSQQELKAWMQPLQNQPLPASYRLPGEEGPKPVGAAPSKKAVENKKKKRRAARKARKRNR
ncbi:MAG: hypothetical protein AAF735_02450 [Myxococcota bacterium]